MASIAKQLQQLFSVVDSTLLPLLALILHQWEWALVLDSIAWALVALIQVSLVVLEVLAQVALLAVELVVAVAVL